ncbi:MAG: hypothetical protein GF401_17985 [Chitinivibrionales bacterium]|nr:hypothetical protein [Chitinivibrionales bacterium]
MISKMREIAPTVILIALIGFVATIFFSWGMDISGKDRKHVVGKIEGKEITWETFDKEVNIERERQREMAGGELQPYQARMIPQQVWETKVSRHLLIEKFKEMKVGASAEEIYRHIRNNPPPGIANNPNFMTDSVFDTTKFEAFLNNPQQVGQQGMQFLEAHVRDFMVPMEKLQTMINAGNMVTKAEIAREYKLKNEKGIFEYAKVSSSSFKFDSSEITDNMILDYYEAHPDSFVEKEQAVVDYVKMPKTTTAEDEREYYNELLEIKSRIESGEATFTEEARIASDDEGSARNGGDLGWFKRGMMVKEFDSVAFSLDTGEISDPVKTKFGYHLLLVEEREMDGDSIARVRARHILRKIQPSAETLDSLQELADTLRIQMDKKGFAGVLEEYPGLSADSAGPFKKGEVATGIGYIPGMTYFVFNGTVGEIAEVPYENQDAFYIVKIARKIPAGRMPLELVRDEISTKLKRRIQEKKAREYLENLIAKKPDSISIASLSDIDSLVSSGITDTVSRNEYIQGVGKDNKVVAAAFALEKGTRSSVVEDNGTFFVVKPLHHDQVESIPWDSPQINSIARQILASNYQKLYYDWYLQVKENADIENNVSDYYYN